MLIQKISIKSCNQSSATVVNRFMKYVVKDHKTKEELCQIVNGPIPQINSRLSIDEAGEFYVRDISYDLYSGDRLCYCVVWVFSIKPNNCISSESMAYWNHVRATEYFEPPGDL